MNKIINRTMVVSLAIMLMVLFAGLGSAKADSTSITEKERLELANKLWGTDITYGEYIEQLFPEAYDKSPDAATKSYYDTKVVWMDLSAEAPDSEQTFTATNGLPMASFFIGFDLNLLIVEIILFILLVFMIKKYERTKEIKLSLLHWLIVVMIYLVITSIVSSVFR